MWLAITIALVIVVLPTVTGCQPFDIKNAGEKLGIIFINITHTHRDIFVHYNCKVGNGDSRDCNCIINHL